MSIYFTATKIPELARFTAAQRRAVYRGAFNMLLRDHPSARWMPVVPGSIAAGLGAVVGILVARTISEQFNYHLIVVGGFVMIMGGVGGFIGDQLLIKRLRPYCRRFIEEHREELSGVA